MEYYTYKYFIKRKAIKVQLSNLIEHVEHEKQNVQILYNS